MARQLRVVSGNGLEGARKVLSPEEKSKQLLEVAGCVLQDAQDTWAELWGELQGKVVEGVLILPDAQKGGAPECGWPQFLEKMWILKHQLDYARRFCNENGR